MSMFDYGEDGESDDGVDEGGAGSGGDLSDGDAAVAAALASQGAGVRRRLSTQEYAARKLIAWAPVLIFVGIAWGVLSSMGIIPRPPVPNWLKSALLVGMPLALGSAPLVVYVVKQFQELSLTRVWVIDSGAVPPIRRYEGGHELAEELEPAEDSTGEPMDWQDGRYYNMVVDEFEPGEAAYSCTWMGDSNELEVMEDRSKLEYIKEVLSPLADYGFKVKSQEAMRMKEKEREYQLEMAKVQADDVLQHPEITHDEELDELTRDVGGWDVGESGVPEGEASRDKPVGGNVDGGGGSE